jgi:hypothetical protein
MSAISRVIGYKNVVEFRNIFCGVQPSIWLSSIKLRNVALERIYVLILRVCN